MPSSQVWMHAPRPGVDKVAYVKRRQVNAAAEAVVAECKAGTNPAGLPGFLDMLAGRLRWGDSHIIEATRERASRLRKLLGEYDRASGHA